MYIRKSVRQMKEQKMVPTGIGYVPTAEERRYPSVWCGMTDDSVYGTYAQLRFRREGTPDELMDLVGKVFLALRAVGAITGRFKVRRRFDEKYRRDYVYLAIEVDYTLASEVTTPVLFRDLISEWMAYYSGWCVRHVCIDDCQNTPVDVHVAPKGAKYYLTEQADARTGRR